MIVLTRPVRRETAESVRDAGRLLPVVIEIHPGYMELRQKGRRRKYALSYGSAYQLAVRLAVEDERRKKRKR